MVTQPGAAQQRHQALINKFKTTIGNSDGTDFLEVLQEAQAVADFSAAIFKEAEPNPHLSPTEADQMVKLGVNLLEANSWQLESLLKEMLPRPQGAFCRCLADIRIAIDLAKKLLRDIQELRAEWQKEEWRAA